MNENDAKMLIAAAGNDLTKRQIEILRKMRDNDEELVYERGRGMLEFEGVSVRTIEALQRACAISMDQFSEVGRFERYTINSTGKDILKALEGKML